MDIHEIRNWTEQYTRETLYILTHAKALNKWYSFDSSSQNTDAHPFLYNITTTPQSYIISKAVYYRKLNIRPVETREKTHREVI